MTITQVPPPSTSATSARARRYSALDLVVLAALLIAAAVYIAAAVQRLLATGQFHPIPPDYIALAYLIAAGIVATRWRWAVIIALLVSLASLVLHVGPGFPLFAITHPVVERAAFLIIVGQPPLMLMVLIASVAKLAQMFRHEPAHAPRWFAPGIGLLAGVAIGALLIGAFAQPSGAGSAAVAGPAGTETVHLESASFVPTIIALHSGDKLVIVDDVPVPHTLTNGSWSASNQPVPGVESGAVVLNNVQLNNNSVTVGPFSTPGTYHIYCTLHPGMNLTIVVQ